MDSQSSGESESDDEELQFDRIKEGKPKKQHKYCFKCSVDQTIFTLGVLSETVYCGVLIDAKTSDSQISQLLFFPGLRGRIDYDKKTLPIEVQISDRDLKGFAEFRFCYAVSAQSDKKIDIIDNKKIVCSKWYETIPVVDTKAIKTFGSTEEVASFIKHIIPDDESAFITSSEKNDLSSSETDKGPEKVSSTGPLAHVVESKLEEIEDQISSTQLHQSSATGDETPPNPEFVNKTNRANTLVNVKDECFEENTETANDDKSTTSELRDSGENALDNQDKKECPELYGPSPKQNMISKSLESQVSHNFNEETENRQSNNANSVLVETSCKFEEHEKLKEEGKCFRNRKFSPSESGKTEYGQSVSSVIKNKKEDKTSVSQSTHIVQAVIDKDILQLGKDSLIISLTTTVGSHTSQGVVVAATDDWAILSFDTKLQVEKFEDVPYFYRVHAPRDSHSEIHREILPNRVNFRVMNDKDFTAEENNVKIKYDGVICWYKSEKDTNYTFASQKKNEGTNWVFTDSQFYENRNLTGFKIYCRNFASQLKQDFNLNRFEIDAGKTWKSLSSVRFEGNNQIIIMRNTSFYLETLQVLIDLALEPNASSLDSGLAIVFIVNFMHLLNARGTLSKIKQETTSSVMNLLRNTGEGLESRLTNRVSKRYPTDVQPNAKSFISYALHVSRKCKSGHTVKWSDDLLDDDATNFSGPQIYQNLPEIQPRDSAQSNSLIEVSGALTTLVASKQPVSRPAIEAQDEKDYAEEKSSLKHGSLSQSFSTRAHLPHETTPKPKENVEDPDHHQVDPSSLKDGSFSQSYSTGAHLPHEIIPELKEKVEDPDQHQVDPSSSKHGSLSQSSSTGAHLPHETIPKPKEKVEDSDQHQVDPSSTKHGSLSQNSSTGAHLPHETTPKPKEKVEGPDQHQVDPSSSKHGSLSQSSSTGAHLPHETIPKPKEKVGDPDQHQVDPSSTKHGSLSQSSLTGAHLPHETTPKPKEKVEGPDQSQFDPSSSKHGSLSESSSTGAHLPHETIPKPKEKAEDPDQHQVDPSSTKHGSLSQSSSTGAHLKHETIPKPKEKAEDPDQHQVDPSSTKHGSLSQSSSTGAHLKHELTPKPKEKVEDHDQHQVDPSSLKLGSLSQSSSTGAHLPHKILSKPKTKIEVHCNQGFSSPKLEFFNSTSQKNRNSNHTSVQEAISNEGYEPSGQIRNRWRILTAVDSKITQIEGELVVFLMLEKEIIYDGKILFVTDSWAILLFEIEPIETNKNHVCFIFGVRSTAPDQVRHFREVLPGDHNNRYIQTANLQKGLENYTGMIVWKKSENFLEKGWNFVGKYLKGNGDYFNQHSKAFEVYCVYFASKFADELNLVTFLRDVSSVWNSLARVYHKKQEDVIVFKEQFSQYQLLDTMVDVARNKQGSNRDLAVVALLQLTNSVFNSADKTFKYVKEHSLAEIFRLAGFENKEKRDESAKKANSREYEDQFRNSNQACFLLIMHRGNDTHVLNVIEWISLTNNLLQSQTSFEVQTLPLVANEFFSSDESKIAMLAQSKNWVSVRNLHKLCLRMDQYIHSLRIALSRDAIDTKLIEKFDLLREMLNDGEFSLRYEQEKLIFDKCIGEIDMFLGGKADFTSIAHQNFILLALDLAEVAEASQQGVCESQRKWFDAIVTYSRNILEASLKPDLAKSAAKFWIEICTNKLKLPNQTSYFRGELAEKVTNYLFSNSQAMLTMAETDNLKLKSSLLGPVFENAELNQLVREFQLTDPQALFNINHSNHRHACGKIFEELLKMFPNIQVLNTYEILHKSAQWKLLLLLITSCPKMNPTEQCKVLMNLIVRAYCTASNEIHKQSISFENLKKIQQKRYVFVSVCHLLHQRDWLHGKSLNAQQI